MNIALPETKELDWILSTLDYIYSVIEKIPRQMMARFLFSADEERYSILQFVDSLFDENINNPQV